MPFREIIFNYPLRLSQPEMENCNGKCQCSARSHRPSAPTVARTLAEGGLVGDLARAWNRCSRLCFLRSRRQHSLDRGDAGKMVDVVAARLPLCRQLCAVRRSVPGVACHLHGRSDCARPPRARLHSVVCVSLFSLGRDLRNWPMGQGEHLQSRTPAGCVGGRHGAVQPHRSAALARRWLPGRVLRQNRHRAARSDASFHAGHLGGSCRNLASLHRLYCDVSGDLLGRDRAWTR